MTPEKVFDQVEKTNKAIILAKLRGDVKDEFFQRGRISVLNEILEFWGK